MIIWRISNYADLSGTGGMFASGRWHFEGLPIVYCCEHPATALLEILVQSRNGLPDSFQLLEIHCPDDLTLVRPSITLTQLHDITFTQNEGQKFLNENEFCLLKVPSAVLPAANNIIVNPRHPDASRLSIISAVRYPFDSRLLG